MYLVTRSLEGEPEAPCLVLKASSSNEYLEGYDCAVVPLSREYVTWLLDLITKAQTIKADIPRLCCLEAFDAMPSWFSADYDAESPESLPDFEDEELVPKWEDDDPDAEHRTEIDIVAVDEREVYWTARPKHSDGLLTTPGVPATWLRAWLDANP